MARSARAADYDGGTPSTEPIVASGPGASSYGYLTPIVLTKKGEKVTYLNGDVVRHNVVSTQGLFRSALINTGEAAEVVGADKLEPGTYEFLCEPHPGMKGQLTVR